MWFAQNYGLHILLFSEACEGLFIMLCAAAAEGLAASPPSIERGIKTTRVPVFLYSYRFDYYVFDVFHSSSTDPLLGV